jgi:hypothetical protein
LRAKEEIIVVFVEMDDVQVMDPWVAWLFFNHCVDNIFPAREAMGVTNAIIK